MEALDSEYFYPIYVLLMAAFSMLMSLQCFKEAPTAPDMQRADSLPLVRKLLVVVVPTLYLCSLCWWRQEADDVWLATGYLFWTWYDPFAFCVLLLLALVIGAELSGGRSAVLALQTTVHVAIASVLALLLTAPVFMFIGLLKT